jgi:DNA invertase Pin-like site-specific DNA recombinase
MRRHEIARSPVVPASNYIDALDDVPPGTPIVGYHRVSRCEQERHGNLDDGIAELRRKLEDRGYDVIDVVGEVNPGWQLDYPDDRPGLMRAMALGLKHGAPVCALSMCRLLRPARYAHDRSALPTQHDYERLCQLTEGLRLLTLLHPDTAAGIVRSEQSRRGHHAKRNKGGRPPKDGHKKRLRKRWLLAVLRLHAEGWTLDEIASEIKRRSGRRIPRSTIWDWIRRFSSGFQERANES